MRWILYKIMYCLNPSCRHARTLHSRNGCTTCPCTAQYMDKSAFE